MFRSPRIFLGIDLPAKNHPHEVKCLENTKRPLNLQFLLLFKLVVTINSELFYELSNRGHSYERVLQGDRFSFYSGHCGNWYEYIKR